MNPYTKFKNKIKNEFSAASYADIDLDILSMWINKIIIQSSGAKSLDYDNVMFMRETFDRINVCYKTFDELIPTTLDDADLDAIPSDSNTWYFNFDNASWATHSYTNIREEMMKAMVSEAHSLLFGSFIKSLTDLTLPDRKFDISFGWNNVGDIGDILIKHMNSMKIDLGITGIGYSDFVILTSPMIVSVIQSSAKGMFTPAITTAFRGPNNTVTVGSFKGAKIISNIEDTQLNKTYIIYKPVIEYRPTTGMINDISVSLDVNTFNTLTITGVQVRPEDFKFESESAKHAIRVLNFDFI